MGRLVATNFKGKFTNNYVIQNTLRKEFYIYFQWPSIGGKERKLVLMHKRAQ